jgi:choline monooxygenase
MHLNGSLPISPSDLEVVPLERSDTIPSSWYTDERVLAFERDAVFGRTWQYVGHESQLASAGDYILGEVAGNPLIVLRNAEGDMRCFYNVCRHRGGPLAMEPCGHVTMLQCKYHGWTYRLDGSLRGVPRFDRSELFDKRDFGLKPVRLQSWEGILFVDLSGEAPPLEEVLGGIRERIAPLRPAASVFHHRDVHHVACNWKAYVDNYLEGYHIPLVHPELTKVLDYRAYRTETFDQYSLQHSPLRDGAGVYGDGEAFYYFVFPNTMLNIMPGRIQVNSVVPAPGSGPGQASAGACKVIFDYLYEDATSEEAGWRISEDVAFSNMVQAEDADICEHVQRGLASRGYDRGRFSPECEEGVYHFQGLLKAAYGRALAGDW